MPTSWYQAASAIMEKIMIERPESILDIGVGFGKYGVLLRETLDIPYERYDKKQWSIIIDGIEAFEGYRNPLHDYVYDNVYYQPLSECLESLGSYDVVLMIDVLEHIPKEQGINLLDRLLAHTNKALLISTPLNPAPQNDYINNLYEAHLSRWTPIDFARFENDSTTIPIAENSALIVKLYPTRVIHNINVIQRSLDDEIIELLGKPHGLDEKLHVAYALPHKSLTGGLKMLVEQIRWLKSRGHIVDAYLCGEADSALPEWMPATVDRDIVIRDGQSFYKHIQPCDLIVSGWYDQIPDLLASNMPVMYWEQGSEPFFGDYSGVLYTSNIREWQRKMFSLPVILTSVSDFVASMIESRYNRKAAVIPNGVDVEFFHPSPKKVDEITILMVGNPILKFKRFSTAISVLKRLWNEGRRFIVRWVCQFPPNIDGLPFPVEIKLNSPQEQLAQLYSSADILLFLSIYEGFGMPPLEAMASGLSVLCADCGGPGMYLKNEHNALIVQPEDENSIFNALDRLICDERLREKISINARLTALDFSLDKSLYKLEEVLYAIKEQKKRRKNK